MKKLVLLFIIAISLFSCEKEEQTIYGLRWDCGKNSEKLNENYHFYNEGFEFEDYKEAKKVANSFSTTNYCFIKVVEL